MFLPLTKSESIVFLIVCSLVLTTSVNAETWIGLRGNHQVDAELLGIWEENAILKLNDGRRVAVALPNLRSDSRIAARKLGKQIEESRNEIIEELKAQAAEAAAAAPNPLPAPPEAPEYVSVPPDTPAVESLTRLGDQSLNGHALIAYYDALPAKYREDIESVVKAALEKLDPSAISNLSSPFHQLGDLIVTRQRWIFSHPRFKMIDETSKESIEKLLLNIGGLLKDGLDPEKLNLQTLKASSIRDVLEQRDAAIAGYLYQLGRDFSTGSTLYQPVSEEGDKATVKFEQGRQTLNIEMTKVDGFWVPSKMAEEWDEAIASAKTTVADSEGSDLLGGPMASSIGDMLSPIIEPLAEAKDAATFHAAMSTTIDQMAPMVPMLAQFAAAAGSSTNQWSSASPSSSYSDEFDGDYDDEFGDDPSMDQSMEDQMQEDRERAAAEAAAAAGS